MMLGFRTGKEQKGRGESWTPFGFDCLDKYSFWTRIRIAALIIFRYPHIGKLHIPWASGNYASPQPFIEEVRKWAEEARKDPLAVESFENNEEKDGE